MGTGPDTVSQKYDSVLFTPCIFHKSVIKLTHNDAANSSDKGSHQQE